MGSKGQRTDVHWHFLQPGAAWCARSRPTPSRHCIAGPLERRRASLAVYGFDPMRSPRREIEQHSLDLLKEEVIDAHGQNHARQAKAEALRDFVHEHAVTLGNVGFDVQQR